MADAILGALLQQLLQNVNSLIQKEVHLFFGVKNDAEKLSRTLSTVLDVLEDAESRKIENKSLANWLKMLKDAAYDATDALEEWALEAPQLDEAALTDRGCTSQVSDSLLSCLNLKRINFRRGMAKKFKEIINKFDEIAAQRSKFHLSPVVVEVGPQFHVNRETSSTPIEPKIYGRDGDKKAIIDILLGNVNRDENVSICPIVGIGGLGKTTLAQSVYNDDRVKSSFHVKIWVCVSDPFDVKRVLKAIVESFKENARDLESLQAIQSKVGELLRGKKYLLVLDDVWNDKQDEWNRLKSSLMGGAQGSSIIVTTRLDIVASITGTMPNYFLKPLSADDCWNLFKSRAFGDRGEENSVLAAIGKDIVKKCGGVPLAATSLGGTLQGKTDECHWKHVRDSEIWNVEKDAESGILPALRLSYKHLSPQLKRCFAYCAIFPKDHDMVKDELICLWIANGFIQSDGRRELEDIGNVIFDELLSRSFFQDYFKWNQQCKMHDLMHDLANSVMEGDCLTVEGDLSVKQVTKTRHLTLNCSESSSSASAYLDRFFKTKTSLHSLIFFRNFDQPLSYLSINDSNIRYLRVLNVSTMEIETLPSSICDLKLLRCLNLSNNELKSVPESIHGLRSLQMLDLSWNQSLKTLPLSIGKLESLRYLKLTCCNTITCLPETIGGLRNLRSLILIRCDLLQVLPETMRNMKKLRHLDMDARWSLKKMPVGIGELRCLERLSGFVVGRCNDSGSISELKNLNNLRGKLVIERLGNVRNVEEVKEAKLIDKQYLAALELKWEETSSCDSNIEVLEALGPLPPCLQKLNICGYSGVYLEQFLECGLSTNCLKKLKIEHCEGIKCLPKLMIGIQQQQHLNNNISSSSSSSSLVQLKISGCYNLTSVSEGLRHQTSLQSLEIWYCSELELGADDFQHFVSLRTLELWGLPKVRRLPEGLKQLTALQTLQICNCRELELGADDLQHLVSLQSLTLRELPKVTSLSEFVQHLTVLQKLQIRGCEKLRRLPEGLKHLTALQTLTIIDCHPELHARCEKEKGQDWHIISHIPKLDIIINPPQHPY